MIHSSLGLSGLEPTDCPADVEITFGSILPPPLTAVSNGCFASSLPGEAYIYWPDVALVRILGGHHITIAPSQGVDDELLNLYLLGPVFALLLYQRGYLVLHASSIAIGGRGVAFVAQSGMGKSTLAAALTARACMLVADDILAVDIERPGCLMVVPGFPLIRVWPDTAIALGRKPEEMPQVHPRIEKRIQQFDQCFISTPVPLNRIYLLAEGPQMAAEHLSAQQALVELIRHTYRVRLIKEVWPPSHLQQYAALVNAVPISRLTFPRDLSLLPDLARMVEEDALRH